jgi:hypothetical protein
MGGSTLVNNSTQASVSGQVEDGGGIYVNSGSPEIVNSTFYRNDAGDTDGGGGAIYVQTAGATVRFSTFVNNTNVTGGDTFAAANGATIEFGRSILDDSSLGSPCEGTVISLGFNVSEVDDGDCGFDAATDIIAPDDLGLGDFGLNGGPTSTIEIKGSSPAKDLVPKSRCSAANGVDQRGFDRPASESCDAGSYERGAT